MVESIKYSLNKGNIVYGALVDLDCAFDCVPHKLLIAEYRANCVCL